MCRLARRLRAVAVATEQGRRERRAQPRLPQREQPVAPRAALRSSDRIVGGGRGSAPLGSCYSGVGAAAPSAVNLRATRTFPASLAELRATVRLRSGGHNCEALSYHSKSATVTSGLADGQRHMCCSCARARPWSRFAS
jgi:hypothetical protein